MKKLSACLVASVLLFAACNKDGSIEENIPMPPEIVLGDEGGVYTVKSGESVTIAPEYRYVADASYEWSIEGHTVCREPSYTFTAGAAGEVYVKLTVTTAEGTARREFVVYVSAPAVPVITLPGADEGFVILAGESLELTPTISDTGLETAYLWEVQRPDSEVYERVSEDKTYIFAFAEHGVYTVRFTAGNADGSDTVVFRIAVARPEDMDFGWEFLQTEYNMSSGRRIKLAAYDIRNAFDAVYTWTVDGSEVQRGAEPSYIFDIAAEGTYEVCVTMKNAYTSHSRTLVVNVCPPEGRYKRPKNGASAYWNKVWEFTAAPGQYVNERYDAFTAEEACAYAEERLKQRYYVSLGGFGGYIVVGFDHSIESRGEGFDFAVSGNSFDTSSEPGIVWVMQDENGDGLPNDTWYELAGSETGKPETVSGYAVTYYRPNSPDSAIPWSDNLGNTGEVSRVTFHTQDYWPAWISADSYTLRGTLLKARNYLDGKNWVQPPYDWGYVDNFSSVDRLSDDANAAAGPDANGFRISNAIDFDGRPANLKYIDFIKVQTGVNTSSGHLGELSTEVCDFFDCSLADE